MARWNLAETQSEVEESQRTVVTGIWTGLSIERYWVRFVRVAIMHERYVHVPCPLPQPSRRSSEGHVEREVLRKHHCMHEYNAEQSVWHADVEGGGLLARSWRHRKYIVTGCWVGIPCRVSG